MKKKRLDVFPFRGNMLKIIRVMKLLSFFLLAGFLQVTANVHSQTANVNLFLRETALSDVIKEIQKQTEFTFFFSPEDVNGIIVPEIGLEKASLEKVLDLCLEGTNLEYEIIYKAVILKKRTESLPEKGLPDELATDLQQKKELKGKVTDEKGQPLPGVSVVIKGTTVGIITDANGKYSLLNVPENATLQFSFVGMKKQEIAVAGSTTINIVMEEETTAIEEVVSIGYGTQSRSRVTTSVSKLDNKVLANIPYANVGSALQGTLSGVTVQSTTGQPGTAPRIIIRGGTSINNPNGAQPLFIIDGIIRPSMDDISADDIESLQVLKDAAATSIYGARGSNGVVILTTKSGKSGKNIITYKYRLTASDVGKKYDLVGARDFIKFFRMGVLATAEKIPARLSLLAAANPGGTGNDLTNKTAYTTQYLTPQNEYKLKEGWQSMPDPVDPTKTLIFDEVDWQDKTFRTGISHDHTLSASGGTEKATFDVGIGYLDNEGIAIGTDYKRLTFNLNGDLKVKDNLNVFGHLSYSNSTSHSTWAWDRSQYAPPTMKYKFEDGTLSPGDYFQSPEYQLSRSVIKYMKGILAMSAGFHWTILSGLSFDPQISLLSIPTDGRSFQMSYYPLGPVTFNTTRTASGSHSELRQQQADAVFTYIKTFKDHNIEAKAGFAYFGGNSASLNAVGKDAASDLIPTLNASATPVAVTGSESERMIIGCFSRINYNFKEKYLGSLNIRYDGASNLGTAHQWGYFPGVSLGWNVYKENFWSALPENLIRLKLRGSYGVNGNISGLGDYQAQGAYSVGRKYGGNGAIQNTVLANNQLKWEQSKTLDAGIDLGLFNSRINIMADIYRRVTDNLLTNYAIPLSTGFTSILTNLGSLENRGLEIEISASVFPKTSDFQWDISFNASKVKNKILKLPPNGVKNNRIGGYYVWDPKLGNYDWLGGLQEGGTMGDIYAYKQLGIYKTDEEAAAGPLDKIITTVDKTKRGGDVNWYDADGNHIIDNTDRVYVGNLYPKWAGGITNSFSYKNFNLLVRMDFLTGHTVYNWAWAESLGEYGAYGGILTPVLRSWQKQGDITDIPRFRWADQQTQQNLSRGNSAYYEKGDFLAVRELTLSYNVPKKIIKKLGINNLSFNLTGNNLYYFTGYRGLNPEAGGTDSGGYRLPRNIIFGVNLSL